jgi:hypothetical protein
MRTSILINSQQYERQKNQVQPEISDVVVKRSRKDHTVASNWQCPVGLSFAKAHAVVIHDDHHKKIRDHHGKRLSFNITKAKGYRAAMHGVVCMTTEPMKSENYSGLGAGHTICDEKKTRLYDDFCITCGQDKDGNHADWSCENCDHKNPGSVAQCLECHQDQAEKWQCPCDYWNEESSAICGNCSRDKSGTWKCKKCFVLNTFVTVTLDSCNAFYMDFQRNPNPIEYVKLNERPEGTEAWPTEEQWVMIPTRTTDPCSYRIYKTRTETVNDTTHTYEHYKASKSYNFTFQVHVHVKTGKVDDGKCFECGEIVPGRWHCQKQSCGKWHLEADTDSWCECGA